MTTQLEVTRRMGQADLLERIADRVSGGRTTEAEGLAAELDRPPVTTIRFPLTGPRDEGAGTRPSKAPSLKPRQRLPIYLRDGFVDRSPERWRLVRPGALRVISLRLPGEVPTELGPHNIPAKYATNAPVRFDLWRAVDHVAPRASAGTNETGNLVCVSWWRNDSKGHASVAATGWELQPPGDVAEWDGLTGWFQEKVEHDGSLLDDPMVRNWYMPNVRAASEPAI